MINYYSCTRDEVIDGYVLTAETSYQYAVNHFLPLIGRLDIQRDALNTKFYSRLESDIVSGCVMPPITIALIHTFGARRQQTNTIESFVNQNIGDAFVLDGIQRLNTLRRASDRSGFKADRPLFVNFVIAGSRDRLLYRMITLNNGQKPMSARHQIDILADAFFEFEDVPMKLVAEKGKGRVRAPNTFKKADFVKGYIAYLSNSVNIDNQKIIEEKMDELIASRIIESDITSAKSEFTDLIKLVDRFSKSELLQQWIRGQNNFIGFCVGAKRSISKLTKQKLPEIEKAIERFELAFKSINVSKVNVGKVRRELVAHYFDQYEQLSNLEEYELLDKISEKI